VGFEPRHRLHRPWQYRRVYEGKRSLRGRHVVAYVLEVPGEGSHAGVVASRKVGGAVVRNRVKRRLRHALRDLWPSLPATGCQVVLIALPESARASFRSLSSDVRDLLTRLGVLGS
jgi:ribonuclease P protein component